MATGRRRNRRLTVGGRRFLWRCEFNDPLEVHSAGYRERGDSWPPDALIVRPEDGPHRRLLVAWPACGAPVVTPSLVASCVEEALRRGWLDASPTLELAGGDVPAGEAGPD